MATRYYPIATSTSRGSFEPSSEQSAVLPNGSSGPSGAYVDGPDFFELGTAKTVAAVQNRVRWLSLGQVGRQSTFMAHGWFRLGAQTISAGTWELGAATLTSDPNANTFFAISVYVWRSSTSSVVGYIYDSTAELGAEWRGDFTAESRLISFSGNSVTAANGDTLIFEIWATAAQAVGSSYTNWMFYDASTSVTDFSADGQSGLASWIDSPVTLTAFDPNAPIGPQTPPNQITISSTSQVGVPFGVRQTTESANTPELLTTVGAGTWTKPAGVTKVLVECWGGGGAGGGATALRSAGGGGASGQYARKLITYSSAQQSISYSVAASVAGGTGAGTTGNDTTWETNVVVAKGGQGGEAGNTTQAGGLGGIASTTGGVGDIVIAGGNGSDGSYNPDLGIGDSVSGGSGGSGPSSNEIQNNLSGEGGSSVFLLPAGGQPGGNGSNYAAGGGSACKYSGANQSGGDGAQGVIRVTTYTTTTPPGVQVRATQ